MVRRDLSCDVGSAGPSNNQRESSLLNDGNGGRHLFVALSWLFDILQAQDRGSKLVQVTSTYTSQRPLHAGGTKPQSPNKHLREGWWATSPRSPLLLLDLGVRVALIAHQTCFQVAFPAPLPGDGSFLPLGQRGVQLVGRTASPCHAETFCVANREAGSLQRHSTSTRACQKPQRLGFRPGWCLPISKVRQNIPP